MTTLRITYLPSALIMCPLVTRNTLDPIFPRPRIQIANLFVCCRLTSPFLVHDSSCYLYHLQMFFFLDGTFLFCSSLKVSLIGMCRYCCLATFYAWFCFLGAAFGKGFNFRGSNFPHDFSGLRSVRPLREVPGIGSVSRHLSTVPKVVFGRSS